ncbi:hypothetical protein EWR98_22545 [Escherichia coli]|nr:hypothetical protein [Escherichia coli]EFB5275901.1 hypothetical protein [Escherichia coli]EFC2082305.1 hypothetical protein [Escherichia coli]EFN7329351.1 hypothetical protein [Escherichia coli]EFN7333935.1 hypothetical protein [Escherichia coli]
MFTPRGNVGQVFHNPVLSRITELVTATRPDGDNKTPALVVIVSSAAESGTTCCADGRWRCVGGEEDPEQ